MRGIVFVLTLVLTCIEPFYGQYCGADHSTIPGHYSSLIKKTRSTKSGSIDLIPVTIHVVQGSIDEEPDFIDLEAEMRGLNNTFSFTGLQFFMCGSERIIRGQDTYDFGSADGLNLGFGVEGTINVYLVNTASSGSQPLCGFAKFPWQGPPSQRYCIVSKACLDGGKTLAHEVGHYLGALHTHETFRGAELVDRSNCGVAGDLLCDTPADPNLWNGTLTGCTYTGASFDANGDLYRPDPSNIMSYAPSQCTQKMTEQQGAVVRSFINPMLDEFRTDCDQFPDFGLIKEGGSADITIQSGESFDIPLVYSGLSIDREYTVEQITYFSKDRSQLGKIIDQREVLFNTSSSFDFALNIDFPLTEGSGKYYFTMILDPDSRYVERSKNNNRIEFEVVVDNSNLSDLLIYPNPVQNRLRFFIRSTRDQRDFDVLFSDLNGRVLKRIQGFKNQEEFLNEFDVSDLPSGLIVVSIEFTSVGGKYGFMVYKE